MTKLRLLLLLTSLASLAACMDVGDPNQLKKQSLDQLCEGYYFSRHPSPDIGAEWPTEQADIKKELDRRQAIAPGEWALIDQGKIQPGMSECALKASWGYPMQMTNAVTPNGETTHYIYTTSRYVDVMNGRVTRFGY